MHFSKNRFGIVSCMLGSQSTCKVYPGGLALYWETGMVTELGQFSDQNWIWFHGSLKSQPCEEFCCVNVYMPHKRPRRRKVWQDISSLLAQFSDIPTCIIGDFNCILSVHDRINCQYREADSEELQKFIEKAGLWDIHIQRR